MSPLIRMPRGKYIVPESRAQGVYRAQQKPHGESTLSVTDLCSMDLPAKAPAKWRQEGLSSRPNHPAPHADGQVNLDSLFHLSRCIVHLPSGTQWLCIFFPHEVQTSCTSRL